RPLIVAGSTGPGEEALLDTACRRAFPAGVQLLCAPRKPERFDEAAAVFPGCARRSTRPDHQAPASPANGRFILDTIGELRKAYALADVIVVGRSFGRLYGSDPMEPAALGKAIVIGPAVDDFQRTVDAMLKAEAIVQCEGGELAGVLADLLADDTRRRTLGVRALRCVHAHQGASRRHADLLVTLLTPPADSHDT
ncbi:MAG: hypothetical protein KDA21_10835, partial [Phycisphaerales bacterium]|nr:hypothetical protein [Phycisphaerales bacterium]